MKKHLVYNSDMAVFTGFAWQVFDNEAIGAVLVRSCLKLPLCLMDPMADASDSLLAKAEPVSDGANASGTTELNKGEVYSARANCSWREERICESNSSWCVREEEVLQVLKRRFLYQPCSTWRSTMEWISTCSP